LTQWEYTSVSLVKGAIDAGLKTDKDLLNKFGSDGWELISVVRLQTSHGFDLLAYFKREKL